MRHGQLVSTRWTVITSAPRLHSKIVAVAECPAATFPINIGFGLASSGKTATPVFGFNGEGGSFSHNRAIGRAVKTTTAPAGNTNMRRERGELQSEDVACIGVASKEQSEANNARRILNGAKRRVKGTFEKFFQPEIGLFHQAPNKRLLHAAGSARPLAQ